MSRTAAFYQARESARTVKARPGRASADPARLQLRPMRIAIDAGPCCRSGPASAPTPGRSPAASRPGRRRASGSSRRARCPARPEGAEPAPCTPTGTASASLWVQTHAARRAWTPGAPTSCSARLTIGPAPRRDVPFVSVVHDLTPWTHPEWHAARTLVGFVPLWERTVERAARFLCVSQTTARDLVAPLSGDARPRVRVARNGVDPEFFAPVRRRRGAAARRGSATPAASASSCTSARSSRGRTSRRSSRPASASVGETPVAAGPRARRRRRDGRPAALLRRIARSPLPGQDPPRRIRAARGRPRALPRRGGLRLSVARRGLRAAGPRGDGVRRRRSSPRTAEALREVGGGRRALRAARATPARSPRAIERVLEDAALRDALRDGGPDAGRALLLGRRGRGDTAAAMPPRRRRAPREHGADAPPRIGIDARKLRDFGIGSYIRQPARGDRRGVRTSEPTASASTSRRGDRDALAALPAHFEIVAEDSPGYSLAELTRLRVAALARPPRPLPRDALRRCRRSAGARAVVTIHDIIHLLYPQFLPNRAAHLYARVMIRRALRRADRIITVSYNSKRDLVDYFGDPAVARSRSSTTASRARFRPDVPPEERERVAAKYGAAAAVPPLPRRREAAQERPQRRARVRARRAASARCRTRSCSPGRCRRTGAASRR